MPTKNFKLLAFIEDSGYNQTTFAAAIGVNRQTLISWIKKAKEPSVASLFKLATVFGEDPVELNEKLGLGVSFTEHETAIQKALAELAELQAQVQSLAKWFSLPEPAVLEDPERESRVNLVLGTLKGLNLTLLDLLTETPLTVADWNVFYTSGQLDPGLMTELEDWLKVYESQPSSSVMV